MIDQAKRKATNLAWRKRNRAALVKREQERRKRPGVQAKINANQLARYHRYMRTGTPNWDIMAIDMSIVTQMEHVNPDFVVRYNGTYHREHLNDPLPRW